MEGGSEGLQSAVIEKTKLSVETIASGARRRVSGFIATLRCFIAFPLASRDETTTLSQRVGNVPPLGRTPFPRPTRRRTRLHFRSLFTRSLPLIRTLLRYIAIVCLHRLLPAAYTAASRTAQVALQPTANRMLIARHGRSGSAGSSIAQRNVSFICANV